MVDTIAPPPPASAAVASRAADHGPPVRPAWPARVAWLASLLFALVGALWSVAVPAYRAPDEAAHLDLVLYLAEGNSYPAYDRRFFGEEVGLDTERHLIDLSQPWPRFDAADAPDRRELPDVDDLGGTTPDAEARRSGSRRAGRPYVYNQMPQHPPLYYEAMATVLRVERWLLPGDALPPLGRELHLLRLVNVLLVAPLSVLAWAATVRMGGGRRAAAVAALLPLCVPQLSHVGAAVNNDNLLTLLGGLLAVGLAGAARGRRGARTDVVVGVTLGLALLTKAFAVMFVPGVVAAYAAGAWTTRRWRAQGRGLALAGAVAGAVGTWWWIHNWIREGEPAPTTESLTRTVEQRPRGFTAEPVAFMWTFAGRIVSRVWAWIGFGTPKFTFDPWVVAGATAAVAGATVLALATAARGRNTERGARRVDLALAWLPVLLVAAFVARRAWGLYETTGHYAFIQGRYLFCALVAPAAVVAIGAARALGRWAFVVVLAFGLAGQAWMLSVVVRGSWSGSGTFGAVDGMLAWSPWPSPVILAVAAACVGATAALVVASFRSDPTAAAG
ncbi:MAG TPA: glycosyltransferase family 39 protein [Acidimicrobiales bacterium]|nr:glycosyltransferase family 39 protein [Acidimicrobiales bacterium]